MILFRYDAALLERYPDIIGGVILARGLATNPHLLILNEPTKGIDVDAKAEIQKLVLDLADEGKSCVFISSELEEVLRTSHRIIVLLDHREAGG